MNNDYGDYDDYEDYMIVRGNLQNKNKKNMKPFDLKLALLGHPVVTKEGLVVTKIERFGSNIVYIAEGQSQTTTVNEFGKYFNGGSDSAYDLFLEEGEWNFIPTAGDRIWVRDFANDNWVRRTFLYMDGDDHICQDSSGHRYPYKQMSFTKPDPKIGAMVNDQYVELTPEIKKLILDHMKKIEAEAQNS